MDINLNVMIYTTAGAFAVIGAALFVLNNLKPDLNTGLVWLLMIFLGFIIAIAPSLPDIIEKLR